MKHAEIQQLTYLHTESGWLIARYDNGHLDAIAPLNVINPRHLQLLMAAPQLYQTLTTIGNGVHLLQLAAERSRNKDLENAMQVLYDGIIAAQGLAAESGTDVIRNIINKG